MLNGSIHRNPRPQSTPPTREPAPEFSTQVGKFRRAKPDIVGIAAHPFTTCGVLREMKRQGVKPKLLVGLTSSATLETMVGCGPEAEGLIIPTGFAPVTPEAKRVAKIVAERYKGNVDLHSAAVFENVQVLKRVIEASGVEGKPTTVQQDRRRIRDGLAQVKEFQGLLGSRMVGSSLKKRPMDRGSA